MVAYPHNPTRVPARAHRNVRAGSNSALPVTPPPTPAPRNCVYGGCIDEALLLVDTDGTDGDAAGDRYLGHDHLYSVCVLFAGDGTVLERCEYDAYGAVQVMTASYTARVKSPWGNPYFFTGRRWDAANGGALPIMYYRAQTHDPEAGRFMQRDPLEYVDGLNLYEYALGRPTIYLDAGGTAASFCPSLPGGLDHFWEAFEKGKEAYKDAKSAKEDIELLTCMLTNCDADEREECLLKLIEKHGKDGLSTLLTKVLIAGGAGPYAGTIASAIMTMAEEAHGYGDAIADVMYKGAAETLCKNCTADDTADEKKAGEIWPSKKGPRGKCYKQGNCLMYVIIAEKPKTLCWLWRKCSGSKKDWKQWIYNCDANEFVQLYEPSEVE